MEHNDNEQQQVTDRFIRHRRGTEPSVRDQSRRFSQLVMSQTELYHLRQQNQEKQQQEDEEASHENDEKDESNEIHDDGSKHSPPSSQDSYRDSGSSLNDEENQRSNHQRANSKKRKYQKRSSLQDESSGFRYWFREVSTAREHGGDYPTRLDDALRAATGSMLIFCTLILTRQQIFEGVWIGNLFFLFNLKDTLGATLLSVHNFATGIVLTSLAALPVLVILNSVDATVAKWLLPVLIFVWSFLIMSCPQIKVRNIMLLVFYILAAPGVRTELQWWEPISWTATYFVGLGVAVLVHLLPTPNRATRKIHASLTSLELDFCMLLRQAKHYADHSSSATPVEARAAIATIEMLYHRISTTLINLKTQAPAAQTELKWTGQAKAAGNMIDWVDHLESMVRLPLKSLVAALTQRVLGEDQHVTTPALRQAKGILAEQSAPSRDRVLDAMTASIAVCHAWADPWARRMVLPDVHDELEAALQEHREHFNAAIQRAAWALHQHKKQHCDNETARNLAFVHLTRRKAALCAITDICDSLLHFMSRHHWESERHLRSDSVSTSTWRDTFDSWYAWMVQDWLWHNPDGFRLALKTSVGMILGSLFVSVDYLWDIAAPFGVWAGMTIASVNLPSTGSSFQKAGNRLVATLIAAAYALLVTDLFPGYQDYVMIPSIVLFTFATVYLKTKVHAYKMVYAAASLGSMLYGSLRNNVQVSAFIPLRIELIFAGIVIFAAVEIFLFPRSSRRLIESAAMEIFPVVRDFTKQATICAEEMNRYCQESRDVSNDSLSDQESEQESQDSDPFQLKKLSACHQKLKSLSAKLKNELQSGLEEPHVGLSLQLDAKSYQGLSDAIADGEVQATLVIRSLHKLADFYQDPGYPLKHTPWPQMHADFFGQILQVTQVACQKMSSAYPDGRLRPQSGNAMAAILAASCLRQFHDVRLCIVASWSETFAKAMDEQGLDRTDPVSIMNTSITTTRILDFCRHLQSAGRHVEAIAHNFPSAQQS